MSMFARHPVFGIILGVLVPVFASTASVAQNDGIDWKRGAYWAPTHFKQLRWNIVLRDSAGRALGLIGTPYACKIANAEGASYSSVRRVFDENIGSEIDWFIYSKCYEGSLAYYRVCIRNNRVDPNLGRGKIACSTFEVTTDEITGINRKTEDDMTPEERSNTRSPTPRGW